MPMKTVQCLTLSEAIRKLIIRDARLKKNRNRVSLRRIAAKSGVDVAVLSRWVNDRTRQVSCDTIDRLVRFYGMDLLAFKMAGHRLDIGERGDLLRKLMQDLADEATFD